eukprot:5091191-Prymnesium_polylepis.3
MPGRPKGESSASPSGILRATSSNGRLSRARRRPAVRLHQERRRRLVGRRRRVGRRIVEAVARAHRRRKLHRLRDGRVAVGDARVGRAGEQLRVGRRTGHQPAPRVHACGNVGPAADHVQRAVRGGGEAPKVVREAVSIAVDGRGRHRILLEDDESRRALCPVGVVRRDAAVGQKRESLLPKLPARCGAAKVNLARQDGLARASRVQRGRRHPSQVVEARAV